MCFGSELRIREGVCKHSAPAFDSLSRDRKKVKVGGVCQSKPPSSPPSCAAASRLASCQPLEPGVRLRGGAQPSVPPGSTGPQRSAWPKRVCLAFCALLRPALSGEQRAAVGPWAGVGEERLSPDPRRPCPPTPSLTAAGHLPEAALQVSGCGAVKSWAQECGSVRGPVLCCVPDGLSGRDSAVAHREAGVWSKRLPWKGN